MRLRLLAIGLCSATTVITALTAPALSSPATARAASGTTIRVGSFNVSTVAGDGNASGYHRVWAYRRPVIAGQILSQRLDVVGVQEANQSAIYRRSLRYAYRQYMDLKRALNHRGGHYALTSRFAYNCVNPDTSRNCRHRNRAASRDNRILYNVQTLQLLYRGAVRYHFQTRGTNPRFLAWAIFRSRSTGKRFFFADTHLDPYNVQIRTAQWRGVIRNVNRLKGSLPVVVVGDFNSSKFDRYTSRLLPAMKKNGYGDVLNQSYGESVVARPRAQSTRRAWISSFNGYRKDVRPYSYEEAKYKVGNNIDWIFAGNQVAVRQWEVVADMDPRTYRIRGVLPSDHNMVRATLTM
jgi:endonuclease/exonuclease/phosphatase family metal-dependent hydrolase